MKRSDLLFSGYVLAIDALNIEDELEKLDWLNADVEGDPKTSSYDGGASI